MKLRIVASFLLAACVSVLLAQTPAKPAAAPVAQSAAAPAITDAQRIEFLKLQRNYADLRGQVTQAQAQLQTMQTQMQAAYDAMTKTCNMDKDIFDSDALACIPKPLPPVKPPEKK